MVNSRRLLKTFLDLVKISSPSLREGAVARYVAKDLGRLGLAITKDDACKRLGGEVGNIWATIKGNVPRAKRIVLNAHIDTVGPCENIKPRIKGGYVYSDGTTILGADNKAGVAVMLEVTKILAGSDIPHGDVELLFTVAEETGLYGARHAAKKALKGDFCLVLDGGDVFEIINQAPSQDSIRVEIIGRAAHAGVRPEEGINAIQAAGEAVSKMRLGRIDFETTANIGVIKGGLATNIIPERALLKGEARSHDEKKLKKQVRHMRAAVAGACKKYKAKYKWQVKREYSSFRISPDSSIIKLAVNSLRKVGIRPVVKRTGGGSDANVFNAFGLQSIIVGAGADSVHTKKERASIRQMAKSAEFMLEVLKGAADEKK